MTLSTSTSVIDPFQWIVGTLYHIQADFYTLAEGQHVTFTLNNMNATNYPNGTVLYWSIRQTNNGTTLNDGDFSSPANAVSQGGSVTVSNNGISVRFDIAQNDFKTETDEEFIFELRKNNPSGTIIGESGKVVIVGDALAWNILVQSQDGNRQLSPFKFVDPNNSNKPQIVEIQAIPAYGAAIGYTAYDPSSIHYTWQQAFGVGNADSLVQTDQITFQGIDATYGAIMPASNFGQVSIGAYPNWVRADYNSYSPAVGIVPPQPPLNFTVGNGTLYTVTVRMRLWTGTYSTFGGVFTTGGGTWYYIQKTTHIKWLDPWPGSDTYVPDPVN
jgi:hypothetical protein